MPYEFTLESFREFADQVLAANGDQATLTPMLADMQSTFAQSIGTVDHASKELERVREENDRLLKANMEIYLRHAGTPAESAARVVPADPPPPVGVDEYLKNLEVE